MTKIVAYRLDWPEDSVGRPRFFGADSKIRMDNYIKWAPEDAKPKVVPLYEEPSEDKLSPEEIKLMATYLVMTFSRQDLIKSMAERIESLEHMLRSPLFKYPLRPHPI